MKYLIIVVVAFVCLSCISKNAQQKTSDLSLEDLVKRGQAVLIEDKIFHNEIDFTSFLEKHLIGVGIYNVDIHSSITFKNCVFNKTVSAHATSESNVTTTTFRGNLSFIGCKFKEAVNFRGSNIYGRLDFSKSKFFSSTNFEEISSYQNAYFVECYFDGVLKFQNSFFIQKANFMSSQFNNTASFQNVVFNAESQFSVCKFYGYADFSLIDCRDHMFFNYAEFHERADLSNAHFTRDFYFTSTKNKSSRFDKSKFMGKVDFSKSTVDEQLSFVECFYLAGKPNLDFITNEKVKF